MKNVLLKLVLKSSLVWIFRKCDTFLYCKGVGAQGPRNNRVQMTFVIVLEKEYSFICYEQTLFMALILVCYY